MSPVVPVPPSPARAWWDQRSAVAKVLVVLVGAIVAVNAVVALVNLVAGGQQPGGPSSSAYSTGSQGFVAWSQLLVRRGHRVVKVRGPLADALPASGRHARHRRSRLARCRRGPARQLRPGGWRSRVLLGERRCRSRRSPAGRSRQPGGAPVARGLAPSPETAGLERVVGAGNGHLEDPAYLLPVLGTGPADVLAAVTSVPAYGGARVGSARARRRPGRLRQRHPGPGRQRGVLAAGRRLWPHRLLRGGRARLRPVVGPVGDTGELAVGVRRPAARRCSSACGRSGAASAHPRTSPTARADCEATTSTPSERRWRARADPTRPRHPGGPQRGARCGSAPAPAPPSTTATWSTSPRRRASTPGPRPSPRADVPTSDAELISVAQASAHVRAGGTVTPSPTHPDPEGPTPRATNHLSPSPTRAVATRWPSGRGSCPRCEGRRRSGPRRRRAARGHDRRRPRAARGRARRREDAARERLRAGPRCRLPARAVHPRHAAVRPHRAR